MDLEVDPSPPGLSMHQLALPLARAPAPPRPAVATLTPVSVWADLTPAARERVARVVRRIFTEVVGDADRG